MGATRPDKQRIAERRKRVAALWLQYVPYRQIAEQVGVSLGQIAKDVEVIRTEFRRDVAEIKEREVTSLDAMENEAIRRYQQDKEREWAETRLRIKDRRARLLGLDAPSKVTPTNPAGDGPAVIVMRWDDGDSSAIAASGTGAGAEVAGEVGDGG